MSNLTARLDTGHRDDNTTPWHADEFFRSDDRGVMDTVPQAAWMQFDDV